MPTEVRRRADIGTRSGICRLTHPRTATLKEIGVMAGTTDKAKGMVKEGAGKVTGDKRMESEGKCRPGEGRSEGRCAPGERER